MENSIEEEIEILEEFKTHGYAMLLIKYEDRNKANRKLNQAIEHILSAYQEVLKENEELKNDYENLSNSVVVKNHCIKNSIPVQTVKDKIRYYQELQDNYIKKYDEINEGLQAMINVLQELLEGRKI